MYFFKPANSVRRLWGNLYGFFKRPEILTVDDQNLYQWWMIKSDLGWWKPRSDATLKLDRALEWYSKSVILDRKTAIDTLLEKTNEWLIARETVSKRAASVLKLKKELQLLLEKDPFNYELNNQTQSNDLQIDSSTWTLIL